MRNLISLLLVLSVTLLAGCGSGHGGQEALPLEFEAQTWTLTFSGEADSPEGLAASRFADAVSSATNGAVTVTLSPAYKVSDGDGQTALESTRDGTVSMGLFDSSLSQALDHRLEVVSLPFLFSSQEQADAVLDGAGGDALKDVLAEYGLVCAGIGTAGFRCPTNNSRPITSPADFAGLTMRVTDRELTQEAYRLWGAQCVTADWPMVFTALRTGRYDGQETPLITADAASVQKVQKYLTRWTGIYDCLFFCVNQKLYDGLSPALREIVDRCAQEAMAFQRETLLQTEADILKSWAKSKVTITELTEEEAALFRTAAQPCYDRFAQTDTTGLLAVFTAAVE